MSDALVPTQLTPERIVSCLRENDISFFIDSSGDVGTTSEGRLFMFLLLGAEREVLLVRGYWNRTATIERAHEILELCNKWNTAMIWPKAYYRVSDDGRIHVCTENAIDFEFGVTDDQIMSALHCGVQTSLQFFDQLDATYPDPAKAAP